MLALLGSAVLLVVSVVAVMRFQPLGLPELPSAVAVRMATRPVRWSWRKILLVVLAVLVVLGAVAGYEIHHALDHMFDGTDFSGIHFTSGC
jgi:preprotein translocase subunit Sss1